jgi:hypothetical protein
MQYHEAMEIAPTFGQISRRIGSEDQPGIKGLDQLLRILLQIGPLPDLSTPEQYSCSVGIPEIQETEGAQAAGISLVAMHSA